MQERKVLCHSCQDRIQPIVSHTIQATKTKSMRVLAVGAYCDPLKSLVLSKSRSQRVVSMQLGQLIWQMSNIRHVNFDYVVPIPLHWTRYAWRGYNQAEEIALVIAKECGKPVKNFLKRIKRTPYLSYYSSAERAERMKGVLALQDRFAQERFYGKHILLVDDVMTTGVTLKEASKELWKLKPLSITAVVVARVI